MTRFVKGGDVSTIPAINTKLEEIETAINDTLSRKGDVPNQMEGLLDMNANRIIGLPVPTNNLDAARLQDVQDIINTQTFPSLSGIPFVLSVAEAQSTLFTVGNSFVLAARYNAQYEVKSSSTTALRGDITLGNGNIAVLLPMDDGGYNALQVGATGDGVVNDTLDVQGAIDRGSRAWLPNATYNISHLTLEGGKTLEGESLKGVYIIKIADSANHLITIPVSDKPAYIRSMYLDGQKNLNTDNVALDGIHCTDTTLTGKFSVEARDVYVERTTGKGWYIGLLRNKPHMTYCYGFNCGIAGDTTADGLHVNSSSDAYIGEGCGFGSNQGRSILIATSATPVVSETEIWWSNHRANIEFFECKDFMLRGCNLDRARVSALRVQGRTGTSRDTPDGFHENSFVIGNTFKNPKGDNGAGSNGDLNFIDVFNSKGLIVSSNNFNYDIENGDVKVDYIISATNSSNITWVGNSTAPDGDAYQCYVSGITDNEAALWSDLTEIPHKFRGKVRVQSGSPSLEFVAEDLALTSRFSRWRVENTGGGDIVLEVGEDAAYLTKETALRCKRSAGNIFEFVFGGMLKPEVFANAAALPSVGSRETWSFAIIQDDGSGDPAFALNDGSNWRLNSFA